MKSFLFTFILLFNCCLFAQTLDPYKFFPSSVGNVWEYSSGLRTEILRDSIAQDSSVYLWVPNYDFPLYRVDRFFNVFWDPVGGIFGPGANWLYYKLDADSGDSWIVDIHHIVDTFFVYKLAKVRSTYEGFFYDRSTTFKVITFYQYQPDSILNEFSWPELTETLAYGIGVVSVFDEEGGGPVRILQGCIIDGDTIGILTSVEDDFIPLHSFELYQNHPNPFNSSTKIGWQSPVSSWQTLKVYDVLGNEVATLVNEWKEAGRHSVDFNSKDLPSGVYIYQLSAKSYVKSRKMMLVK
jgi:hypothetical protein